MNHYLNTWMGAVVSVVSILAIVTLFLWMLGD